MKTFTIVAYSATLLIATLTPSLAAATPNAQAPAYRADGYDYVNAASDYQLTEDVYHLRNDDHDYPAPVAHAPFARRELSEPNGRFVESESQPGASNTFVLAPPERQRPYPHLDYVRAPVPKKGDTTVFYRAYLFKVLPQTPGRFEFVPATLKQTSEVPRLVVFYPFTLQSIGTEGRVTLVRAPLSVAEKDVARLRAAQAALPATVTAKVSSVPSTSTVGSPSLSPVPK